MAAEWWSESETGFEDRRRWCEGVEVGQEAQTGISATSGDGRQHLTAETTGRGIFSLKPPTTYSTKVILSIRHSTLSEESIDPISDIFPSPASEFAALRTSCQPIGERRSSLRNLPSRTVLSASASYGEFTDVDTSAEIETPREVLVILNDVEETGEGREEGDELLASPIELDLQDELEKQTARLIEADKRGSGLVMSDELDNLEKRESPSTSDEDKADVNPSNATIVTTRDPADIPEDAHPSYGGESGQCESTITRQPRCATGQGCATGQESLIPVGE